MIVIDGQRLDDGVDEPDRCEECGDYKPCNCCCTSCEFKMSIPLKKQGVAPCGKPAYYNWDVRNQVVPMCKEHGETCAGNWTHELTKLP